MAEAVFSIPVTGTIHIEGNTVTINIKESALTIKIEGLGLEAGKRLELSGGKTMFDLVLEAARTFVRETGENEFSGADLYHIAIDKYPELRLRRNSWASHVIASSANHPSHHHYTSRRRYFRHLGRGKYSLEPDLMHESSGSAIG
jgi:hypothetical protein